LAIPVVEIPVRQLYVNPKSGFQNQKSIARRFNPANLRAHAAIRAGCFINYSPVINEADCMNRTQVHAPPAANAFFYLYFHTTSFFG